MSQHETSGRKELVRELYRTIYEKKAFDMVPEFYATGAVRHGGLQGDEALQDISRLRSAARRTSK